MAYINDRVFDNGLTILDTEANRLDICFGTEPATYADATSANTRGNSTSISVGAPANGVSNGRRVTVAAITGGTVTSTGTVGWWALSDTANSRLLATGPLSTTFSVTSGNTFSLDAFDITIPDAA